MPKAFFKKDRSLKNNKILGVYHDLTCDMNK